MGHSFVNKAIWRECTGANVDWRAFVDDVHLSSVWHVGKYRLAYLCGCSFGFCVACRKM